MVAQLLLNLRKVGCENCVGPRKIPKTPIVGTQTKAYRPVFNQHHPHREKVKRAHKTTRGGMGRPNEVTHTMDYHSDLTRKKF